MAIDIDTATLLIIEQEKRQYFISEDRPDPPAGEEFTDETTWFIVTTD